MSSPQHGAGAGAFHGFSTLAGLIGMVFLTPRIWPLVRGQVWDWLTQLYDYETAWWLLIGCHIAAWLLTFLVIRMALSASLAAISLLIVRRMM